MVVKSRNILTESETNSIRKLYGLEPIRRNYVIEACISVDGRYLVVRDEIFDNIEQKTIGNIWESIDMFKTIFTNVKVENSDEEYTQIKEGVISLPILEGVENLFGLRDYLINEGILDSIWGGVKDAGKWVGNKLSSAGHAIADTAKTAWKGTKALGHAIMNGDWSEVWALLKKGVKWLLRKLKDAMYSTIGIVVDGILLATGVGKGATAIAWALVLGLDIYQFIKNDWPAEDRNSPEWMHLLDIGFDILGLVTAGGVAKGAKLIFEPLKKLGGRGVESIAKWVERSPAAKSILEKMFNGIKKVPALMERALEFLSKKFPKGYEFVKGIMGSLSNMLKRISSWFSSILGFGKEEKILTTPQKIKTGLKAGAIGTGIAYGLEKKAIPALQKVLAKNNKDKQSQSYDDLLTVSDKYANDPNAFAL
jgi:hypothetical protein